MSLCFEPACVFPCHLYTVYVQTCGLKTATCGHSDSSDRHKVVNTVIAVNNTTGNVQKGLTQAPCVYTCIHPCSLFTTLLTNRAFTKLWKTRTHSFMCCRQRSVITWWHLCLLNVYYSCVLLLVVLWWCASDDVRCTPANGSLPTFNPFLPPCSRLVISPVSHFLVGYVSCYLAELSVCKRACLLQPSAPLNWLH